MHTSPLTTASAYLTDDDRWLALDTRDPRADGQFFTCVHTTGIYCRPTCPARRPNRENVSFVTTRQEALRSGFRPCKRCTPDDPSSFPQRQAEMIARACTVIESSEEPLTLDQLASRFEMSPFHFHRVFKANTGVTPARYAEAHRIQRVRSQLAEPTVPTVTQAIHGAGYSPTGRFYASSASMLGMTPSSYRAGGAGVEIRVATASCSLGMVLVAATRRGICAIMLGDDSTALRRGLTERLPQAVIREVDAEFDQLIAGVVCLIEEPARSVNLPLDVRGTAFQHRVWQALRDIPLGETASYSQIAEHIGAPTSVRAVAQACARNQIAVAIPCHRAVGIHGELTGYAWGTDRKRSLLNREHEAAESAD